MEERKARVVTTVISLLWHNELFSFFSHPRNDLSFLGLGNQTYYNIYFWIVLTRVHQRTQILRLLKTFSYNLFGCKAFLSPLNPKSVLLINFVFHWLHFFYCIIYGSICTFHENINNLKTHLLQFISSFSPPKLVIEHRHLDLEIRHIKSYLGPHAVDDLQWLAHLWPKYGVNCAFYLSLAGRRRKKRHHASILVTPK